MPLSLACRIQTSRTRICLVAGVALLASDAVSADAMLPDPAKGSVNASGKFVPAQVAGDSATSPATPGEWKDAAAKLMEKTGEHSFRIGLVQCDRAARSLTIPATVNAREGLIEYALVTRQGKIHEALLSTDALPLHVQIAAMLLGISPQPGKGNAREVMIEVEWASNGPARKVALEDLVTLKKGSPESASGLTMARGSWNFTGSQIDPQGFAAAREGSFISLIPDPVALMVNPRPGREDDNLHVPNSVAMPATGAPVSVRIFVKPSDPQVGAPPVAP